VDKKTREQMNRLHKLCRKVDKTCDEADELLGLGIDSVTKKRIEIRKLVKGYVYNKIPEGIN